MKKLPASLLTVALVATSAAIVPMRAAAAAPESTVASRAVTGVLRALTATGTPGNVQPLHSLVIDTGHGTVDLPKGIVVDTEPGEQVTFNGTTLRPAGMPRHGSNSETVRRASADVPSPYAPIPQRHLLVIPFTWPGAEFTATYSATLASTLADVDARWNRMSGGIEDLTVQTLPVATIAPPATCDDATNAMSLAASKLVADAGLKAWTTNLMLVLPGTSTLCWWGGLGHRPGSTSWINSVNARSIVSQLGQNMGLPSAGACTAPFTVSVIDACNFGEYLGGAIDPMGCCVSPDTATFSAYYLKKIGWLPDSQWTTWNGTQTTFALQPKDAGSGGLRAVRIDARGSLLPDAPGEYWLQYSVTNDPGFESGVFLTLVPTKEHLSRSLLNPMSIKDPSIARTLGSFTWLCDVTPARDGHSDFSSAFVPDVPWSDPTGMFTITVKSVGTTATVVVSPTGKAPLAPVAAFAQQELTAEGQPTDSVRVTWIATRPSTPAAGEAVTVETTLTGTTLGCSAPVFAGSCVIPHVPTGTGMSVTARSRNYAGVSAPVVRPPGGPAPTLPSATLNAALDGEALAVNFSLAGISDGGSGILSVSKVRLSDGWTCALTNVRCWYQSTMPRTAYTASVDITNAVGVRTVTTSFATAIQLPLLASYKVTRLEDAYSIAATPFYFDVNNVDSLSFKCADSSLDAGPVSWHAGMDPVVFTVPLSTPEESCSVITRNTRGSHKTVVRFVPKPKPPVDQPVDADTVTKPAVVVRATRTHKGTWVKVTWKVVDQSSGDVLTDFDYARVSRIGGKVCRMASITSCITRGLSAARSYKVTVHIDGVAKTTVRVPRARGRGARP